MRREHKICVVFNYPPIPVRHYDWCAYLDGEEEKQQYGYGETFSIAVKALLALLEEEVNG